MRLSTLNGCMSTGLVLCMFHQPEEGSNLYVAVDDYTHTVYTQLLFFKSEAPEAFKAFRAATENGSGKRLREVMTDNARELSMGEMRDICERDSIKLHSTVPYHPVLNRVAERAIGVLTTAARAMLHDAGQRWVAENEVAGQ